MERLTPLATAFLDAEDVDPRAALAIGSLAVFEAPRPPFEEFVELIAGRLPADPALPAEAAQPCPSTWRPRRGSTTPTSTSSGTSATRRCPLPGGRREIGRFMSRVMSRRMDRDRPLWEYWFCEGLLERPVGPAVQVAPQPRRRGVGHGPLPAGAGLPPDAEVRGARSRGSRRPRPRPCP